jgi:hypothetical protein
MRLEEADEAIASALGDELLDTEILEAAAARAGARVATPPVDLEARRHQLETALTHAENALGRLTQAVAEGGAIGTLVQAIRDQERRHQALSAELADLKRPRVVPMTAPQLRAVLSEKASEWRALLRKHAPIARQMLRKLVDGRIVFPPDQKARRYTFRATGTLATFFSGIVCPQGVTSPTGATRVDTGSARGGQSRMMDFKWRELGFRSLTCDRDDAAKAGQEANR